MHGRMRLLSPAFAILVFALAAAPSREGEPAGNESKDTKVQVKVVKYKGLVDLVKAQKGKVVVVDFWSTTCLPCIKEFPHLVEMHNKYGKDGLVAVSVSLDDASEQGVEAKVQRFLESRKAAFTNLILDEQPEVWQQKLQFDGPPSVFVFSREGKRVKHFKDGVDFGEVEKLAISELKK